MHISQLKVARWISTGKTYLLCGCNIVAFQQTLIIPPFRVRRSIHRLGWIRFVATSRNSSRYLGLRHSRHSQSSQLLSTTILNAIVDTNQRPNSYFYNRHKASCYMARLAQERACWWTCWQIVHAFFQSCIAHIWSNNKIAYSADSIMVSTLNMRVWAEG